MAYIWSDEKKKEYNLTIPIYKNWLLFIGRYVYPGIYDKYEYCDWHKALERGVGLCSQQALTFVSLLADKNIPAKIVGLKGHVVLTAQVNKKNDEWWIIDADNGVIIDKNIKEIENDPKIVRAYYLEEGYNGERANEFERLYQKDGNIVYAEGVMGYIDCNRKKYYIEKLSYYLIWIIPIFMIFPYAIFNIKKIICKKII